MNDAASPSPLVVILIVAYNHRDDLEECLASLLDATDDNLPTRIVVVDNASCDGTADLVNEHFPEIDLITSNENLGFTGGNNLGWVHIAKQYPNAPYLMLLNPDTLVKGDAQTEWLRPLVDYLEAHPRVAIAQPKILLHDPASEAPPRFNTAGNVCHFLGFGFVSAFEEVDEGQYDEPRAIDFASGAALVVRTKLIEAFGLFDEAMFLYCEDVDLSWKMRQMGHEAMYVPCTVVYHKHKPEKTLNQMYHLEKNRWWLLLSYYRWRTLLLIGPAWDMTELGVLIHAAMAGQFRAKCRAIGYF
ncbi:MAG: glycosyltransferase family 2 protein, partial [Firmicutes bacterium]|nr:glycosyltransferase family 2 protein [Bacillota bacterium]